MTPEKNVCLINRERTMVLRLPREATKELLESGDWTYTNKSTWRRFKQGKNLKKKDRRTLNEVFDIEE